MKKKYIASLVAIVLFVSGAVFVPITKAAKQNNNGKIPGQYIVVFKDGVDPDLATDGIVKNQGLGQLFTYKHALKGFAATIPQEKLDKVKNDPRVAFVAEDRIVTADGKPSKQVIQPLQKIPTGISRIGASGIANEGAGVVVAVLDTGIDLTHPDLTTNILNSGKSFIPRTTANDDNGHGTHVAGTIAGIDNSIGIIGVAPSAKLVPVKVLDKRGSGTWSTVIAGIDWVTANASAYNIKVANMSLGGGGESDDRCGNTNNDPLHQAICKSVSKGITYVVAAGNEAADTKFSVPAAYNDAVITVSALADSDGKAGGLGSATSYGKDDTFATFSNFGEEVDLGAPGVSIYSTYKGGGYATMSGTSMAAPHVSGAAALYIASHSGASWEAVRDGLIFAGEVAGTETYTASANHPEKVVNASNLQE